MRAESVKIGYRGIERERSTISIHKTGDKNGPERCSRSVIRVLFEQFQDTCRLNRRVERSRALERRECRVGGTLSLVLETIDFVSRTTFVSRKGEEREPAKGGKRASVSLLQFSSNDESLRIFRSRWKQIWKNYRLKRIFFSQINRFSRLHENSRKPDKLEMLSQI